MQEIQVQFLGQEDPLEKGKAVSPPIHIVHTGVFKPRILQWFVIPFSSGQRFVRTLHHDPSVLCGPA